MIKQFAQVDKDLGKKRIAFVAGVRLSKNMEAVLNNFGKIFGDEYILDLVLGTESLPHRLARYYRVVPVTEGGAGDSFLGRIRFTRRALAEYLRKSTPTIVINVCQPPSVGFMTVRQCHKYNVPVVIRMTTDSYYRLSGSWAERSRQIPHRIVHGIFAHYAYVHADQVWALGEFLASQLRKRGIAAKKIKLLPQPFDPVPFRYSGDESKAELKRNVGLDPAKKIILFTGRLVPNKGLGIIVELLKETVRRKLSLQFCIVGRGPLEKDLMRFSRSELIMQSVPHSHIAPFYWAADCFVYPARTAGLPNSILEAKAAGLWVVGSETGEIPEYADEVAQTVEEYLEAVLRDDRAKARDGMERGLDAHKIEYNRALDEVIAGNL